MNQPLRVYENSLEHHLNPRKGLVFHRGDNGLDFTAEGSAVQPSRSCCAWGSSFATLPYAWESPRNCKLIQIIYYLLFIIFILYYALLQKGIQLVPWKGVMVEGGGVTWMCLHDLNNLKIYINTLAWTYIVLDHQEKKFSRIFIFCNFHLTKH